MTDDLEHLRRAMDAATPPVDPDRRAANLQLGKNNFDAIQGSAQAARLTSESRPIGARLIAGVFTMLNTMTSRGGLVASTAIVAVGLILSPRRGVICYVPARLHRLARRTLRGRTRCPKTLHAIWPPQMAQRDATQLARPLWVL